MTHSDFSRADRVGSAIQRELASLIRDLRDPPPGLITIQEVRVTRDLAHAKVFFTVLGAEADEVGRRLRAAAPHLRHTLSRTMRLRSVPELHFIHDTSIETGERLDALITEAVSASGHESEDKTSG